MRVIKTKAEILARIEMSLDTMRPYLKNDGGNVEVVELTDDMNLKLRLLGNCGTCPQSIFTMKAGIEEAVLKSVPEVKNVEAVNLTEPPNF
ncbi:NifU family protein [Chitinophagales bacterium]|nr:NifU family protein [Chitinophagales bacterium]|tara:strand:+ start:3024 stop:3296 length:273 start_codon:yes stop_codon:yes gene_type:complete